MNNLSVLLAASLALGGCMATVSPAGEVQTSYLAPAVEVVPAVTTVVETTPVFTGILLPRPPRYVHAVRPRHHFRPAPAPRPLVRPHAVARPVPKSLKPDPRPRAHQAPGVNGPGHRQGPGHERPGKK